MDNYGPGEKKEKGLKRILDRNTTEELRGGAIKIKIKIMIWMKE
jgi:hypothetical protein